MNNNDKLEDINLYEIINVFLKRKFLIITLTFISALSAVFYSLNQQDIYQSSAILVANNSSSSKSNNLSGLSSMANLAGINLQSSSGVGKEDLATEMIKSRGFFNHIAKLESVYANLTSVDSYDPISKKIIYDEKIYNPTTNQWKLDENGNSLKPNLYKAYENYLFNVKIIHDKKSGFLYLSFQHPSPVFARNFTSLIITELNLLMKNKDLAQSTKAIEYLYDQLINDSYIAINKSISSMIESNMYTKMMASIESEYFVSLVDKPYEPEFKVAPIRWLICIIGTLSGFIFSLFLSLILNYYPILSKNLRV